MAGSEGRYNDATNQNKGRIANEHLTSMIQRCSLRRGNGFGDAVDGLLLGVA